MGEPPSNNVSAKALVSEKEKWLEIMFTDCVTISDLVIDQEVKRLSIFGQALLEQLPPVLRQTTIGELFHSTNSEGTEHWLLHLLKMCSAG